MKSFLNIELRTLNIQDSLVGRLRALAVGGFSLVVVLSVFTVHAQSNPPRIGFVYPAGGQVGATIQLKVGGQFLQGVTNVYVTGGEVEGLVTHFNRPMPQGQFNKLRDRLQELREKREAARKSDNPNTWTSADEQEMTEMRDQILENPPQSQRHAGHC